MKAAIITGAGSGIGLGVARRMLADGWLVTACDVTLDALEDAPGLRKRLVDVRDGDALRLAAETTLQETGRIDALVACAAVYHAAPFLELDEATWDETFAVNAGGSLRAAQAVLPAMRAQGAGNIVFFSSTIARSGAVDAAAYAATKGAILGLMRSLALEVAKVGIRVNSVTPGITDTAQPRGHMSEDELFSRAKDIPLGRIGHVDDMVETVMFLLSEDASFVTGQDIRVTGGAKLF
jgi:2-hydroxycyclohexanecarboxyl-CoA dehydrogenase